MANPVKPPPRTRVSGPRTYSAAEVGELRVEWERDQRESEFQKQLARLEGQYNGLPAMIEASARRIFQELFVAAQSQAVSNQAENVKARWRRADTLIALGQLVLAVAIILVAARH